MEYRRLGRSGLSVSEFALGTMIFGTSKWGCDEATATTLIDRYLEAGGNFLDTADGYRFSEEICGRALRGKRDGVVISTKFGMPVGMGTHERGTGRKRIRAACEASLRRLQTDHIDLYWIHVDDVATPLEETLAALDDLVHEGKILYTGISNMRAYRVMKALSIADGLGANRFIAFQGDYNLIVRTLEREHFAMFAEEGLGFLSWSPLAAGMLTGKVRPDGRNDDTRLGQRATALDAMHKNDRAFAIVALVQKAAAEIGCTPAQVALAWQRTRPVTATILGARTLSQLDDNLASLDVTIPAEILTELDRSTAV